MKGVGLSSVAALLLDSVVGSQGARHTEGTASVPSYLTIRKTVTGHQTLQTKVITLHTQ